MIVTTPLEAMLMNAFGVNVSGNDDGGGYNWSATPGFCVTSIGFPLSHPVFSHFERVR